LPLELGSFLGPVPEHDRAVDIVHVSG
jgi:hypothetical protein